MPQGPYRRVGVHTQEGRLGGADDGVSAVAEKVVTAPVTGRPMVVPMIAVAVVVTIVRVLTIVKASVGRCEMRHRSGLMRVVVVMRKWMPVEAESRGAKQHDHGHSRG